MRGYAGALHDQPAHTTGTYLTLPGSAGFNGTNALALTDAHNPFTWDGLTSFTVAGWFKVATLPSSTQLMNIWSQTADPSVFAGYALQLNGSTGFLNWSVSQNINSGNQRATAVPAVAIVQGRWYLCQTALFTPNAGSPEIAIEIADATTGVDTFTTAGWLTPGPTSSQAFRLGSGPGGAFGGLSNVNLIGDIDNGATWGRPLTGAEWSSFKNNNGMGLPQGVDWSAISGGSMNDSTAWWNLDQRAGAVLLTDSTANNRSLSNLNLVTAGPERLQ